MIHVDVGVRWLPTRRFFTKARVVSSEFIDLLKCHIYVLWTAEVTEKDDIFQLLRLFNYDRTNTWVNLGVSQQINVQVKGASVILHELQN